MFTEAYLEPNWTSTIELIFTSFKSYVKMYLIREKTYNCENSGRKSVLLTMEQFDFSIFEILQSNGIINKEGFLN